MKRFVLNTCLASLVGGLRPSRPRRRGVGVGVGVAAQGQFTFEVGTSGFRVPVEAN